MKIYDKEYTWINLDNSIDTFALCDVNNIEDICAIVYKIQGVIHCVIRPDINMLGGGFVNNYAPSFDSAIRTIEKYIEFMLELDPQYHPNAPGTSTAVETTEKVVL